MFKANIYREDWHGECAENECFHAEVHLESQMEREEIRVQHRHALQASLLARAAAMFPVVMVTMEAVFKPWNLPGRFFGLLNLS